MKTLFTILLFIGCKSTLIGQASVNMHINGSASQVNQNLDIYNLGEKINSANDEMFPNFIQSDNRLYFDYRSTTFDGRVIITYYSDLSEKGWSKPKPFNPNRVFKDFVEYRILHISEDDKEYIVGGRLFKDNVENWCLYRVENLNGKWEIKEKLDWINTVMSMYSIAFTENLDTLYFSASHASGTNSLFYTVIDYEEKKHSRSVEIEDLSSPKVETIIGYKNDTLWFSSNGYNGYGSYDIYYSVKKDNLWSAPINLGYPINSSMKEFGYCKAEDKIYISSNREGSIGGYDIFEIVDKP